MRGPARDPRRDRRAPPANSGPALACAERALAARHNARARALRARGRDGGAGGDGGGGADAAAAGLPIDLFCAGVWAPLHAAMVQRLGAVFELGIAATVHRNFSQTAQFADRLAELVPERSAALAARLARTIDARALTRRWNLPVYLQLRHSELTARLGAAALDAAENARPRRRARGRRRGRRRRRRRRRRHRRRAPGAGAAPTPRSRCPRASSCGRASRRAGPTTSSCARSPASSPRSRSSSSSSSPRGRGARSADTPPPPRPRRSRRRRGRAAAAARGARARLVRRRNRPREACDARALCDRLTDARDGAYCARAAAAVASDAARGFAPRLPDAARARARARALRARALADAAAPLDVLAGDAWHAVQAALVARCGATLGAVRGINARSIG